MIPDSLSPKSVPLDQRDRSLDAVRGLAILGILLANITALVGPALLETRPTLQPGETWLAAAQAFFVSGKFRGLLSLVFGVGIAIQFAGFAGHSASFGKTMIRRMLVLLGIGLFHAVFIWGGDILVTYAITGLATSWIASQARSIQLGFAISLLGLAVLMGVGVAFIPADAMLDPLKEWERNAFTRGHYGDQTLFRLAFLGLSLPSAIFMLAMPASLFMLGIHMWQTGALAFSPESRGLRTGIWVAFAVGVVISAWLASLVGTGAWPAGGEAIDAGISLLVAPGLLLAATALFRAVPRFIAHPFMAVGRYALTIYILQSVMVVTYVLVTRTWGDYSFTEAIRTSLVFVAISVVVAMLLDATKKRGPIESLYRRGAGRL